MDVVKRNVEKLRGRVEVRSGEEGTEFTLKIPLTLAIVDGVTVKVGRGTYALRLDDILEFHKAERRRVTRTQEGGEVLRLREEILPVIKLHEFFAVETEKREVDEGLVVVTQAEGRKVALLVDGIEGYQQIVVKALPAYLGRLRGISGCSVLGDGTVSLIVDIGTLVKEELEQ